MAGSWFEPMSLITQAFQIPQNGVMTPVEIQLTGVTMKNSITPVPRKRMPGLKMAY